jgi:hypothetical protein
MRRLPISVLSLAVLLTLVLAPAAQAMNDGRGIIKGSDKISTDVGFILIAGFTLFVVMMSTLQRQLDKRKEARKAAQKALGSAEWRGGW